MTVTSVLPPIEVPQLSGGRERARALVDGGAGLLRAEHVSREFGEYRREAARDHGVAERLRTV